MSGNQTSSSSNPCSSNISVDPPKIRRFPVEPVETSIRSSNSRKVGKELERKLQKTKPLSPSPPRKYLPEPVETSFHSNRQKKVNNVVFAPENFTSIATPNEKMAPSTNKLTRKFVPELIQTSSRSKKAGDSRPATLPTDKTDSTPSVPNIYTTSKIRKKKTSSPQKKIDKDSLNHSLPCKPRRQNSMRPHCNTRHPTIQGTYHTSLDPIISFESGSTSDFHKSSPRTPSLSQSVGSSEHSLQRFQFAGMRESCDDRFSGYLLALAAKAAEKQLREQALLAAFPNEGDHQIVEHFYNREIENISEKNSPTQVDPMSHLDNHGLVTELEIDQRVVLRRRSSDSSWAIQEMQMHQEKLTQLQDDQKRNKIPNDIAKPSYHDQFWSNALKYNAPNGKDPVVEKELQKIRSAANPPMLGAGLKFPMCPSPKSTTFESDQKSDIKQNRSKNGGGLWGGYCVKDETERTSPSHFKGLPLIQTPLPNESFADPFVAEFEKKIMPKKEKTPSLPGVNSGVRRRSSVSEPIMDESKISSTLLEEFNDHFVTQVYNYLSLGFSSVAWQFDEELSHISKIPVEALRLDDLSSTHGHIGLKHTDSEDEKTSDEIKSTVPQKQNEYSKWNRWRALKIYILEWGKQHSNISQPSLGPGAWGVITRRGSWAI